MSHVETSEAEDDATEGFATSLKCCTLVLKSCTLVPKSRQMSNDEV